MLLEMILSMEKMAMNMSLTNIIFFDTDCISAFLWVKNESILEKLYYGRIIIPRMVYDEMSKPRVSWMKDRIDLLIKSGVARICDMDLESYEYDLYLKLTALGDNRKVIGKGEASCISLAKKYNAIIASNNLKDVSYYIEKFSLRHITTGDILLEAYNEEIITEDEGNAIWAKMIAKRRKLGANTFSDYMKEKDPFYSKENTLYLEKKYKDYKNGKLKLIDEDIIDE